MRRFGARMADFAHVGVAGGLVRPHLSRNYTIASLHYRKMKHIKYLHKYSLYLILSTVLLLPTSQVKSIKEFHYALFTSGPEGDLDSSGVIPAMELAEEEIFKDPLILKGFRLSHIPVQDTMVGRYLFNRLEKL
jgi:hypothetical protein